MDGERWWERGSNGGLPGVPGVSAARLHVVRAEDALRSAEPTQWRASAARAFGARLGALLAQLRCVADLVDGAALAVDALEAELAAARAALSAPLWSAESTGVGW